MSTNPFFLNETKTSISRKGHDIAENNVHMSNHRLTIINIVFGNFMLVSAKLILSAFLHRTSVGKCVCVSVCVCVCVCVNKIVDNSKQTIVNNKLLKITLENV